LDLNGEYFILEENGIPEAGIMTVDDLEDYLDLQNPGLKRQIRKVTRSIVAERHGMRVNSSPDCGARPPNPRSKSREGLASLELSRRRRLNESFEKPQKETQRFWTQWKNCWRSLGEDPHNRSGQHKIKKLAGLKSRGDDAEQNLLTVCPNCQENMHLKATKTTRACLALW
jgi:hypothetical protein